MHHRFLFGLVFGSVTATSALAYAEAGVAPDCHAVTAPAYGRTVPANFPAIALSVESTGPAQGTLLSATLTGSNPATLAQSMDPRTDMVLYTLDKALDPSANYELQVTLDCKGSFNPGMRVRNIDFQTGPESALPTETGTLKFDHEDARHWTVLALAPTKELEAYLAVTMFEVYVGGQKLGTIPYGYWWINNAVLPISVGKSGVGGLVSDPLCSATETSTKPIQIEIRPHVAGATTDPAPASLATTIDCSDPPVVGADPVNPGGGDGKTGEPAALKAGCNVGGDSHGEGASFALAVVAMIAASARRTRTKASRAGLRAR